VPCGDRHGFSSSAFSVADPNVALGDPDGYQRTTSRLGSFEDGATQTQPDQKGLIAEWAASGVSEPSQRARDRPGSSLHVRTTILW
jgi:hypothetical protein